MYFLILWPLSLKTGLISRPHEAAARGWVWGWYRGGRWREREEKPMWWQARNKRGDNSCVRQESDVPTQNKRRKSNRRKEKQSRKTSVRRSSKLQLVAQASNGAVRCITSFLENSRRQTSNQDEAINSLLREAASVCTTRPSMEGWIRREV